MPEQNTEQGVASHSPAETHRALEPHLPLAAMRGTGAVSHSLTLVSRGQGVLFCCSHEMVDGTEAWHISRHTVAIN